MEYICIDFETANASYGSACEIGIAHFVGGEIIYSKSFLIKPHKNHRNFHWYNTKIHGITSRDVMNAPEFDEVWREISHLFNDTYIVCHNVHFDIAVLRKVLELYSIEKPHFKYLCTVDAARRVWPELPKHKLNIMSQFLGVELEHHKAKSDAIACGMILKEAMHNTKSRKIETFIKKINLPVGIF